MSDPDPIIPEQGLELNSITPDLPGIGIGKNWNKKTEEFLFEISKKCLIFREIHEETAILYEKRFNYLTFFLIFNSFLVATILLIPTITCNDWFKFLVSSLSTFSILLATINKYLNYQKLSEKHRTGSEQFLKLDQFINVEKVTTPKFRNDGIKFVKWAGSSFGDIKKGLPYPPDKITRLFDKRLKDLDIVPTNFVKDEHLNDDRNGNFSQFQLDRINFNT
jgi:hypothetical protein